MGNRVGAVIALVLAVALLAGTGCVSKSMYRNDVEDTDRRIGAVEDAVESTGRKVDDLGKETDQKITALDGRTAEAMEASGLALTKAEEAELLAMGTLLWDITITDDGVKFDFGQAKLSSSAMSSLDELIATIKGYGKALYLEIEGHTDDVGGETLNQSLGWKRADAVRNYLSEKGIPLHAMSTISYGESRPVADNSSGTGRAQNRRVVVRVLE